MIPSMIVEGKTNTDFNLERIVFGSYYLVHTGTSSDMNRSSILYIALKKSNNCGVN